MCSRYSRDPSLFSLLLREQSTSLRCALFSQPLLEDLALHQPHNVSEAILQYYEPRKLSALPEMALERSETSGDETVAPIPVRPLTAATAASRGSRLSSSRHSVIRAAVGRVEVDEDSVNAAQSPAAVLSRHGVKVSTVLQVLPTFPRVSSVCFTDWRRLHALYACWQRLW